MARVSIFAGGAEIENFIPSRSWLNARISLTDEEFAKNPKSDSKDFTLGGSDASLWQYNLSQVSKNAGKGVTIYIVDSGGFFDGDFVSTSCSLKLGPDRPREKIQTASFTKVPSTTIQKTQMTKRSCSHTELPART